MDNRELKIKVKNICEYAMLEGKNTDWDKVLESFALLEEEYDSVSGFDIFEDKEFTGVLTDIVESIEILYTFGDSEKAKVLRLYLIYRLYDIVMSWKNEFLMGVA